jgi:hypothetical protein
MAASPFYRVLVDVRERDARSGVHGLNEQGVWAALIESELRALGWSADGSEAGR